VKGGETTIGSVSEGFYPLPTREPTCYLTPSLGGQSMSLRIGDNSKWRKVGELWTYVPYLICQVPPDFYTMINKSISSPHNISGRYDIPHYRLYNRYSILSSN